MRCQTSAQANDQLVLVMLRAPGLRGANHSIGRFMVYHFVGGGISSDLGCLMTERLSVDYGKISLTVWCCPQVTTAVIEPYNGVLCVHSLRCWSTPI